MSKSTMAGWVVVIATVLAPSLSVSAASIPLQDYHGVKYVTGGVGQDERDYLKSVQDQFNLGMMFAASGGAFLSSVRVVVQNSRGETILDAVADGPYLYAALPAGSYTVSASVDQQSQQRLVKVGIGRFTRADFHWR